MGILPMALTPICPLAEIRCPKLDMPDNGGYKCSDGAYFNSRCEFFCAPGYSLKGQKTATCQHSKTWTVAAPTCVGKPADKLRACRLLGSPAESFVAGNFTCLRCNASSHLLNESVSRKVLIN